MTCKSPLEAPVSIAVEATSPGPEAARIAALRAMPQLLTIPAAADRLCLSRATVYRLINVKTLPVVRIGGRTLIDAADLAAFVAASKTTDASAA